MLSPLLRVVKEGAVGLVAKKRQGLRSRVRFGGRPELGQPDQTMSTSRNRARSRFSSRRINQELQGAQDALIAFEGYGTNGPMLHVSALERPADRGRETWLQRFQQQWHQWFASVRSRI